MRKMKLNELYLPYEDRMIDRLFDLILERFKSEKRAPYLNKDGTPKEDEFLELKNINYPSEYINVYRRFDNPEKWDVTFKELKNAIKLTLRNGRILRSGDYNKMTGTSNFVGTPLHILIALLSEDEYKKYSLVGRPLKHLKFGSVKVEAIDFKDDFVIIEVENKTKKIKIDYWEIEEKDFKGILSESAT